MNTVPRLIEQFVPSHYQLSLDIDRTARAFTGTLTLIGMVQPNMTQITLHAKDLDIDSVTINGQTAEFTVGEYDTLIITHQRITVGEHIIVIGYHGRITDSMHGMYPCKYMHQGVQKELVATQFESHHAREVFPCVDEPEAKATFDVTLTTELGVTVLGNLHITDQHEEDGRLVTTLATTPRMSTYLLAWVYGELHRKTALTNRDVEVNVWASPAQSSESLDFALEHAVKSIEFFDEYFGTPYPLPKSDHVALPDFSSGAMENWGLVTYRESALLADPATTTVASKQYIATVISHELSHQWFGNLVTMKWWNDLWLNESFATLMEYLAVDAIHPEWNAWLDFASHESTLALRRDAIDGVQSVQVDVNHPDEISSLFDGAIVYAKGARLMRMCQSYVGDEAFQRGLASYFAEHNYSNTEADDLWRHLSRASGKNISSLMNTWISQPGYPVVHVTSDGLAQEQFFVGEHAPSSRLWPIPLGAESTEDVPALLETRELKTPIADDEMFNTDSSAHFLTHYLPEHQTRLLARDDLSDLTRLQLLHEHTLLVRGGYASSGTLIDMLMLYSDESSEPVWDVMALAFGELKKFVETDKEAEQALRAFAGRLARAQYERLGWMPSVGELESDTKLRSTILAMMVYSRDEAVLAHVDTLYGAGVESVDAEVRPLIISSVVGRSTDIDIIKSLFELYQQTSSADLELDICVGVTSVERPDHISYVLEQMTNTELIRAQDNARWFVYLIRNRYAREATWTWVQDNWSWVVEQFGGDKSYDYYPRYAAMGIMNQRQRDEYVEFFAPKRDEPALTRVIDLGINEIDARLDLLSRDSDAVRKRLLDF